ncbi:MAG TPA: CBS domain-containing protein [Terriglobales bacterium]|nr:CBS domain-containing protein [Terriglobales bacterium]
MRQKVRWIASQSRLLPEFPFRLLGIGLAHDSASFPTVVFVMLQRMSQIALTELLGSPVLDPTGQVVGRVREVALCPQEDSQWVSSFVVKAGSDLRLLPLKEVDELRGGVRVKGKTQNWPAFLNPEGFLLLSRDLLDQQIIDVHGRKVVRVNDIDLKQEPTNHHIALKMEAVDIGARGAVRRLLKGIVPYGALQALLRKIPPRLIPWDYVDLIETDPARRVKLKIEHDRLAKLHPADIADIVEELSPDEREAVFETLDEDVAAEALEEVDPKLQRSIIHSLDSERAADIVEEMDPDAAADLLGDLPESKSEEILEEMEPEQREEVEELLEHKENTAAGRMTTDYLALQDVAIVDDALELLRNFEGGVESVVTLFLVDIHGKLTGVVPLQKLVLANHGQKLKELSSEPLILVQERAKENDFVELFDKYNLLTLPVVDDEGKLMGVITADDIISLLRNRE